jgi:mRNA-degrading endonuclease YafQ of YafQ-DinJ toxin-antitoxin module
MYKLIVTNRFDKDIVKSAKRGLHLNLLEELFNHLRDNGIVPQKHKPHILSGTCRVTGNATLNLIGF